MSILTCLPEAEASWRTCSGTIRSAGWVRRRSGRHRGGIATGPDRCGGLLLAANAIDAPRRGGPARRASWARLAACRVTRAEGRDRRTTSSSGRDGSPRIAGGVRVPGSPHRPLDAGRRSGSPGGRPSGRAPLRPVPEVPPAQLATRARAARPRTPRAIASAGTVVPCDQAARPDRGCGAVQWAGPGRRKKGFGCRPWQAGLRSGARAPAPPPPAAGRTSVIRPDQAIGHARVPRAGDRHQFRNSSALQK